MRITAEERRLMNRRNKDRIPPALRAAVKALPAFVMVVSTTLFVSPEAWAKVIEGKARAMVVVSDVDEHGNTFTKRYSKEELQKKMPGNPVIGLDYRIAQEVTGVINQVGTNLGGGDQSKIIADARTSQPAKDDLLFRAATLQEGPSTRHANIEAMRVMLASETQKAASTKAKTKFDFVSKIGAGFKFNLDIKSLFSRSGAKPSAPVAQSGNVRYGLIVEDIVPDLKSPKRAALGSSAAEEMKYAGHAEVRWTIGPISESRNAPIFAPVASSADTVSARKTGSAAPGHDDDLFARVKIPSPNFNGTATPENFENFAKVDKANMPAWRFDLVQEDGYYNMSYRTATNGKRLSVEHNFRIPVAGTVEIGRRFDDKWDVLETSAYNILYAKNAPLLSVHYLPVEDRLKADLNKTYGSHVIGIQGRGKAPEPAKLAHPEEAPEAYSLTYTTTF